MAEKINPKDQQFQVFYKTENELVGFNWSATPGALVFTNTGDIWFAGQKYSGNDTEIVYQNGLFSQFDQSRGKLIVGVNKGDYLKLIGSGDSNVSKLEVDTDKIQTKLTAGDGISIKTDENGNAVISSYLDTSIYVTVPNIEFLENLVSTGEILTSKIYLVPISNPENAEETEHSKYAEYIYLGESGGLEKIGEFESNYELSNVITQEDLENELAMYYTKSEADDRFKLTGSFVNGVRTTVTYDEESKNGVVSAAIIIQ